MKSKGSKDRQTEKQTNLIYMKTNQGKNISTDILTSDSIVEHRVLDTRTFGFGFEYSKFRVIQSSNRA